MLRVFYIKHILPSVLNRTGLQEVNSRSCQSSSSATEIPCETSPWEHHLQPCAFAWCEHGLGTQEFWAMWFGTWEFQAVWLRTWEFWAEDVPNSGVWELSPTSDHKTAEAVMQPSGTFPSVCLSPVGETAVKVIGADYNSFWEVIAFYFLFFFPLLTLTF